jgi:hypothetical protein
MDWRGSINHRNIKVLMQNQTTHIILGAWGKCVFGGNLHVTRDRKYHLEEATAPSAMLKYLDRYLVNLLY